MRIIASKSGMLCSGTSTARQRQSQNRDRLQPPGLNPTHGQPTDTHTCVLHRACVQARNRQAMNEIRKVINWAQQLPAGAVGTTPPHPSRPSSSASRRHHTQVRGGFACTRVCETCTHVRGEVHACMRLGCVTQRWGFLPLGSWLCKAGTERQCWITWSAGSLEPLDPYPQFP